MDTETQTTETVTAEKTETVEQQKAKTPEEYQAAIVRMEAALLKANNEAAKNRKTLEAHEKAEAAKKDAELSETDKLRKQLAEYEAKVKQSERKDAQAAAAVKAGLPAAFASRLQGETPEELEADAKSLLEALPKAEPVKTNPHLSATNPSGASGGLTQEQRDAQTRDWIKGGSQSMRGGGYSLSEK